MLIKLVPPTDTLARAVVAPTVPPNVVKPLELVSKPKAPSIVELNNIAPLDVLVHIVLPARVTALE